MQKIIPNIWLNDTAKQLADHYQKIFDNFSLLRTAYYPDAGQAIHGHQAGDVLTMEFAIDGFRFIALNGGPSFSPNPSISFSYFCDSAEQVDQLHHKLAEGGQILMELDSYDFAPRYSWLNDKFNVSWQIIQAPKLNGYTIVPHLSFVQHQAGHAEQAIDFYTSVFPDSAIGQLHRYGPNQIGESDHNLSHADFVVLDQPLTAMDSSQDHQFNFSEGISLMVTCQDQAEIDKLWADLSADPQVEACGWLKDKYGLSWQISPIQLDEMLHQGTPDQVKAVTEAFLAMKKFDIAKLQQVYDQAAK